MSSYTHAGHLYRRGQTVFLALCLLACTSNDPTHAWRLGAPSEQQPVAPASVTNLPGCATVTVEVSGTDKVTAHFPADSACKTGLVLVAGGPATYDRPHGGRLTLPIRIVNRSGAGVLSPVRLALASDSVTVLAAPGLSLNGKKGVTPISADSTTGDGTVWFLGGNGAVGFDDSTASRAILLSWPDGVQNVRTAFGLTAIPAVVGLTIDVIPPDSVMSSVRATLYDSANLSRGDSLIVGTFPRNVVVVHFKPSADVNLRRAAIESVGGILFGGVRTADNGDGAYLVEVPAGGSNRTLLGIIERLNAMPQVDVAWVDTQDFGPISAYPNDGTGWDRHSWTPLSQLASGDKWGLEAISAPLAWGCTTGDNSLPVGVVDNGFSGAPDLDANIDSASRGALGPPSGSSHGVEVMSVLGAVGNNGIGMTGVMWHNRMKPYRISPDATVPTPGLGDLVARGISSAAHDHVPVVNISEGLNWLASIGHRPGDIAGLRAQDSTFAEMVFRTIRSDLEGVSAPLPLMVVGAGNDSIDAHWSVFPRIKELYPDRTIVVAAADSAGSLWSAALPYGSTGHRQGSNFGLMVDVAAPGDNVTVIAFDAAAHPALFGGAGTSLAAPFVTGIAGLLYSQVRGLGPAEARQFVIDGAMAAGRPVQLYHLVNAYASLEELARRPGTPLCGNRMWLDSMGLEVERGSGVENIDPTSQEIEMAWLGPYHGGRKISLASEAQGYELLTLNSGGTWDHHPDPNFGTPGDSGFSGTLNSLYHLTHDADSAVVVSSDHVHFTLTMLGYSDLYSTGPSGRVMATVTPTLIQPGGFVCSVQNVDSSGTATCLQSVDPTNDYETTDAYATPSPLGDSIYLVMNVYLHHFISLSGWASCAGDTIVTVGCMHQSSIYSAQSERADVWALPWSGGSPRVSWSLPGQEITWMGEAEDGSEFVFAGGHRTAAGFPSGTVEGCTIRFVDHRGRDRRPAITPYLDDCNPERGTGGIAPTAGVQMAGTPGAYTGGLLMTRAMRGIETR